MLFVRVVVLPYLNLIYTVIFETDFYLFYLVFFVFVFIYLFFFMAGFSFFLFICEMLVTKVT